MPFYLPQPDGTFLPTQACVGPWDPKLQHGGPPAALLGRAFESFGERRDVRVAYFSLDFLGSVPLAPMTVRVELARPGKRIELLTGWVLIDGRPALRATAWRLQIGGDRGPRVGLDATIGPLPERAETRLFEGVPRFGYGDAFEWRFSAGGFHVPGPAQVWARMKAPFIGEEPPSPLVRVLALVDAANGVSWEADFRTHLFVPVNLTVSLTRAPEGEWIGMDAKTALAGDGVGTTRAELFDTHGGVGQALQTLFVSKR